MSTNNDPLGTVSVSVPLETKEEPQPVTGKGFSKNGKRLGRPPGITKTKAGRVPQKPGPKKGNAAIFEDYRQRMLNSPKSRKVLGKVFEVALDDDHPHQAACLKMVMDRIIPASAMGAIAGSGSGQTAVTINITGFGEAPEITGETLEHEQ